MWTVIHPIQVMRSLILLNIRILPTYELFMGYGLQYLSFLYVVPVQKTTTDRFTRFGLQSMMIYLVCLLPLIFLAFRIGGGFILSKVTKKISKSFTSSLILFMENYSFIFYIVACSSIVNFKSDIPDYISFCLGITFLIASFAYYVYFTIYFFKHKDPKTWHPKFSLLYTGKV